MVHVTEKLGQQQYSKFDFLALESIFVEKFFFKSNAYKSKYILGPVLCQNIMCFVIKLVMILLNLITYFPKYECFCLIFFFFIFCVLFYTFAYFCILLPILSCFCISLNNFEFYVLILYIILLSLAI